MAEMIVSLPQRSKYDIMHLVVMRMKLVKMTLCLCLSLMTLCGCRATHDQVLVTCYPLQYLVEQIAQDRVSCVLLSENTLIQRAQIRDDYQELLAQSDALLYLVGWNHIMKRMRMRSRTVGSSRSIWSISWETFRFFAMAKTTRRSHGMREMPLTMSICIIPIPRCGWMR